jgi:hypothetical protein
MHVVHGPPLLQTRRTQVSMGGEQQHNLQGSGDILCRDEMIGSSDTTGPLVSPAELLKSAARIHSTSTISWMLNRVTLPCCLPP